MSDLYIYLFEHELAPVKIGRSTQPQQRLAEVQRMCPFDVECATTIEVVDAGDHRGLSVERGLHKYYGPCHKSGEWFDLPREEIAALSAIDSISDREIATVSYDLWVCYDPGSEETILHDLNKARLHLREEADGGEGR